MFPDVEPNRLRQTGGQTYRQTDKQFRWNRKKEREREWEWDLRIEKKQKKWKKSKRRTERENI